MALANRSEGLSDAAVLNCFLSGLNRDVRRDVVAQCPTNLLRAVSLAKLYEEKYTLVVHQRSTNYNHRYSPLSSTSTNLNSAKTTPKQSLPLLLPTPSTPPIRNSNVRKITPAEMQLRREKGLCYFCDEKFTFNHRCPNRQLLMLQTEEEDFEPDNDTENVHSITHTNSEKGLEDNHHLSLNAMKGGLGVGTIHFIAHINTLPVTVLVDGGNSDNFLQPRIAKFLKLAIEPAPLFKVMVGNGNYMTVEGMIEELNIHAQGAKFELPVFLLPISGAYLILGANWLKTIGSHIADYDSLQLKLLHEGKFITLQGEIDGSPTQAHLHHIRRMINTDSIVEIAKKTMEDEELRKLMMQHTKGTLPNDKLSKFGHFIALKADFNSKSVAEAFINHVAKIHGFPRTIVSDRDRVLIGSFWQHLFKAQGTTLEMSSTYHPQSDGQTEAKYWYNSSYHHNIGMSPFKVVFGREPPSVIPYEVNSKDPPTIQESLTNRDKSKQYLPLPLTTIEFGPVISPMKVLDKRVIRRNSTKIQQVLVHWQSTEPNEATWEDLDDFQQAYPQFNLEDKVVVKGKGIVTSRMEKPDCAGNSVERIRQMEEDPQKKDTRRSTRLRKENVLLMYFDN
ncbi:Ribonuclease H-like superfamily [Sesbania bispinosa]|nr:Ribonuclease H-like superfamily [Sesbania bispinosa]